MATESKASSGRSEHTKPAHETVLAGAFQRRIKITMLGAGSGFTPRLVSDVISITGNKGGTIALVDIDQKRLMTMNRLIENLLKQRKAEGWTVMGK